MKKNLSILPLIFCGLWSTSQAMASISACNPNPNNLVANCGFESGDFTSWTIGGNTLDPIQGGIPEYYGLDAFDAHSGNFGAYMSQDFSVNTSAVTLSQTLATVVGEQYMVSFWLEQDSAPQVGFAHTFSATWAGTTILSLTPTVAAPGSVGVFNQYSFTETATTANTILSFAFENDDNYWSFDDTSVGVPEPSTGILAGMALCALLLLRRSLFTSRASHCRVNEGKSDDDGGAPADIALTRNQEDPHRWQIAGACTQVTVTMRVSAADCPLGERGSNTNE